MADNYRFAQLQNFSLAGSGCIIGATTIVLKSMTDIDGNALTMSGTFGAIGFGTLEPGNGTLEEQISFTGLTNNANGTVTLTGVSNVSFVYPYTATSGVLKTHAGSTTFVISNTSGFYDRLSAKADDETITGTWTFTNPNYPKMDTATPPPTADEQFATKKYVDDVAIAGAPDATNTVKGITKLSVAAASATDPIAVGDNDGRVPTQNENNALVGNNTDIAVGTGNKFVTQTGLQKSAETYAASATGNDTYVITLSPVPISYSNGMTVRFKADVGNTGAATLNVNSLGAISITKNNDVALSDGDIEANQIVEVTYNSTGPTFQMQSQTASSNSTDIQTFNSSNTWTKPTGAKKVLVQAWGGGGSGSCSAGTNGSGGGGGGMYIERWINASDLAGTVTVTVGAGGTAVSATNVGVAGGDSTFGTHLTAYGGALGDFNGTAGKGGSGGIVYVNLNGFYGDGGNAAVGQTGVYSSGGGGATNGAAGAAGGAAYFGGAGGGGSGSTATAGGASVYGGNGGASSHNGTATSGSQPGGGGGGNSGTGSSGAGGAGRVIVTTYF